MVGPVARGSDEEVDEEVGWGEDPLGPCISELRKLRSTELRALGEGGKSG
jgi:hypothetical protein